MTKTAAFPAESVKTAADPAESPALAAESHNGDCGNATESGVEFAHQKTARNWTRIDIEAKNY
jgi:hypothetical protein